MGAVCLDADGSLAAATSTGGRLGQRPGRVGDTPVIGAGTRADRQTAVSCTGVGEAFIRSGAADRLAGLVAQGINLSSAAQTVIANVGDCGGSGGLIAVDAQGNVTAPYSTDAMPRAVWRAGKHMSVGLR